MTRRRFTNDRVPDIRQSPLSARDLPAQYGLSYPIDPSLPQLKRYLYEVIAAPEMLPENRRQWRGGRRAQDGETGFAEDNARPVSGIALEEEPEPRRVHHRNRLPPQARYSAAGAAVPAERIRGLASTAGASTARP